MKTTDTVWWIDPSKLCMLFVIPLYIVVYLVPHVFGQGAIATSCESDFSFYYFLIGLGFLIFFAFASYAAIKIDNEISSSTSMRIYIKRIYLDLMGFCTIFGYSVWFYKIFVNPNLLFDIFMGIGGSFYEVREEVSTIPGITTMSQFGVVYTVLYFNRIWGWGEPFKQKRYKFLLILIFTLTFIRVFAWSERLALIELLFPIVLMYFYYKKRSRGFLNTVYKSAGPYIGLVLIILFFGATEFFRSWVSVYSKYEEGFFPFILSRFVTYYYSALNNGAGLLEIYNWPVWSFENVIGWIYKFPLLGEYFQGTISLNVIKPEYLRQYGDPEFNNMSGIFMVIYDLGLIGSFFYVIIWGFLMGYLYKSFVKSSGIGMMFYPVMLLSLLEVTRIVYLSESRVFPIFLGLAIGYLNFSRRFKLLTDIKIKNPEINGLCHQS